MTKSAAAIQSDAAKAGSVIIKGSELDGLFIRNAEARTDLKLMRIRAALAIGDTFGDNLSSMPVPDSGPEGSNPDLYSENKGKGKVKRTGSFWGDIALSAHTVRQWTHYKKELEQASSQEGSKDAAYEHLWKKGPEWIKAEKSMISQRITAAQNLSRDGARIMFKMNRLTGDEFDGIKVIVDMDDTTNDIKRTDRPILLWQEKKGVAPTVYYFSAGEFLALNLDRALEMGGTSEAIRKSGAKPPVTGSTAEEIKSVKTFLDTCVSFYAFLRDENNITKLVNHLVKEENRNEVKYMSEVYLSFDSILKGYPKVREVYEEVTGQSVTTKGNKTSDKELVNA